MWLCTCISTSSSLHLRTPIIPDDDDYTAEEIVLTFDEDTQRICRDIDVTDDDVTEEEEDFVVTLTTDDDQAETGPPDRAVVTIEDNDRESPYMESHFFELHHVWCCVVYMKKKHIWWSQTSYISDPWTALF